MIGKDGKDVIIDAIEDAREEVAAGATGGSIFTRMFRFYASHCIIIRYDYRLVATEVVVSLALALLCIIVFLIANTNVKADPTIAIKSGFLAIQAVAIVGTAIIAIVYNLVVKTKEVLIVMLKILVAFSLIVLVSLAIYKMNMDKTYDKAFYRSYFKNEAYKEYNDGDNQTLSVTIAGMKTTTIEEDYVQRCVNSYFKFTIRALVLFVGYLIEIGVIIYIIIALTKIKKIKDDNEKDDKILFDDEINCRY